jgi:hypothetical protein
MCCRFSTSSHDASRELVHEFRHRTLVLVKALILQKKVGVWLLTFNSVYLTNSYSRYYFMDILWNDYVHINTR